MDVRQFKTCLMVHGGDLRRWPEETRRSALRALAQSAELRSLWEAHARFEETLRARGYEEPSSDSGERIIAAVLRRKGRAPFRFFSFLSECFSEFSLPDPLLTGGLILLVGIVIGVLNPIELGFSEPERARESVHLQAFLYDQEEAP